MFVANRNRSSNCPTGKEPAKEHPDHQPHLLPCPAHKRINRVYNFTKIYMRYMRLIWKLAKQIFVICAYRVRSVVTSAKHSSLLPYTIRQPGSSETSIFNGWLYRTRTLRQQRKLPKSACLVVACSMLFIPLLLRTNPKYRVPAYSYPNRN